MQRVCFLLRVRPEKIEEYREAHRHVWQEMREALTRTGWHDYSLFLAPDGLLVGYLLCEDFQACLAGMQAEEINERWQTKMAPFFLASGNADDNMHPLEEVFHLD
ncbi:L-rhamnose mutarotase [Bryocella elongata]|uniref:L-rhamnose mutarotase n=1 Tax=Bryocella elongata TaxID=863522 RepID=A0A1H5W0K2_9BACT|nr:L-rhamnose mutarotase [Bryocella elongata]SEF92317.1 L-rhamnose mutarotase [Bryocella elongata]